MWSILHSRVSRQLLGVWLLLHVVFPALAGLPGAQLDRLAQDPQWLQLLGYHKGSSDIVNADFFLHPQGNRDARQELAATLDAFARSGAGQEASAQCKYTARFLWLSRQLDFDSLGIDVQDCPGFDDFTQRGNVESVSIIFASGYLQNPASYFGHQLIKLNYHKTRAHQALTDTVANYGAAYPPDENMLVYIAKGILGGYQSRYTHQDYYYHLHNYNDSDFRDLWEYELDLSRQQVEMFVARVWELMSARHTYYFFDRNCAFRIAEVTAEVTGADLVDRSKIWETPQAVMQKLAQARVDGKSIVKDITYIPSRQTRLYSRYFSLDAPERRRVHAFIRSGERVVAQDVTDSASDIKVADTLIDYYKFRGGDDEDASPTIKAAYRDALSARFALPPSAEQASAGSAEQPHMGHSPSYTNIAIKYVEDFDAGLSIRIRPVYYDSLDAEFAQTTYSALSIADLSVTYLDDDLYVEQFRLAEVESIGRNFTGLPGDSTRSWGLYLGAEPLSNACRDCLATSAYYRVGRHFVLAGEAAGVTVMLGGGYLGRQLSADNFYASVSAKLHLRVNRDARMELEIIERESIDSPADSQVYRLKARHKLSRNRDIRLEASHNDGYALSLSTGFYW